MAPHRLPTWMDLAEASHPGESTEPDIPPVEGISIAPSFHGVPLQRSSPLFFEFGSGNAVHHGKWKLVRARRSAWELYDLDADRTETQDLFAKHPERVRKMATQWEAWFKRCTGRDYAAKKAKK